MDISQYRKPVLYFAIVMTLTWACWFTTAVLSWKEGTETLQGIFLVIGLLVPMVVALVLILGNKELRRDVVGRLIGKGRVSVLHVAASLVFMPISMIASICLSCLLGGSVEQFQLAGKFTFTAGFIPVLAVMLLAPTFEELGWHTYGMDSLRARSTLFASTVLFAAIWAFWHLPLFWVKGYYQNELLGMNPIYAVNFMVSVVPFAILMNWLYYKNRRRVWLAVVFHITAGLTGELFMVSPDTKIIQTIVLCAFCAVLVLKDRKFYFDRAKAA